MELFYELTFKVYWNIELPFDSLGLDRFRASFKNQKPRQISKTEYVSLSPTK